VSDVFCPSWDDLVNCLGLPADAEDASVTDWADRFLAWGAGMVLITRGTRGSFLAVADTGRLQAFAACGLDPAGWAGVRTWQVPQVLDHVTTTNGAGDAYKAAFLARLVEGDGPQQCLESAARVVSQYLRGLPLAH
jgi:sugar/nucleoside kinase (ribokinase family)